MSASDHRVLKVLGETVIVCRDPGRSTGLDASVIEEIVPPGFAAPWHRHTKEDEITYVIEGSFRIWRDDEVLDIGPGDVALLPRNQAHTFKNVGATEGRILTVITPAGLEEFFVALEDRHVGEDEDALVALAAEFGLEIVGPPPD